MLSILVPTQVVAAVDEGGGQREGVRGLGDEGAGVGDEGDVEEVFGYAQRVADEDLGEGEKVSVCLVLGR